MLSQGCGCHSRRIQCGHVEGAGQVVDEDEEEDWADDRALGDSVGKREGRCGSSADELGAAGKVAAEPAG